MAHHRLGQPNANSTIPLRRGPFDLSDPRHGARARRRVRRAPADGWGTQATSSAATLRELDVEAPLSSPSIYVVQGRSVLRFPPALLFGACHGGEW